MIKHHWAFFWRNKYKFSEVNWDNKQRTFQKWRMIRRDWLYQPLKQSLQPLRLCSKSFKLGFRSILNENFQMYELSLEKAEEPEIKLPAFVGSQRKQRNSRKHLLLLHWLHKRLWLCGSQQTGKLFKKWEYQTTFPASWETCV